MVVRVAAADLLELVGEPPVVLVLIGRHLAHRGREIVRLEIDDVRGLRRGLLPDPDAAEAMLSAALVQALAGLAGETRDQFRAMRIGTVARTKHKGYRRHVIPPIPQIGGPAGD